MSEIQNLQGVFENDDPGTSTSFILDKWWLMTLRAPSFLIVSFNISKFDRHLQIEGLQPVVQ